MEDKTKSQAPPERYDALREFVSRKVGYLPVGLDSAFKRAERRRILAQLKLRDTLKAYWTRSQSALESLRPFDLLPHFQEYAEAMFNALGEECIELFQDFERYDSFLNGVEGWVLEAILPTPPTFEELVAELEERLAVHERVRLEDSGYHLKLEAAVNEFKGKRLNSYGFQAIDRLTETLLRKQIIRLGETFSSYKKRAEDGRADKPSWGGDWEWLFDYSALDAFKQQSDSPISFQVAQAFGAALKSQANRGEAESFWSVALELNHASLVAAWWKMSAAAIRADSSPNSSKGIAEGTKFTDSASWRNIREDFESLLKEEKDWSLIWNSRPFVSASGVQLQTQWTWLHPADANLRARASAIFRKAARVRGYNNEDKWVDELRSADFVRFQISGHSSEKLPDGTYADDAVVLEDAIKHSITLCHQLEASGTARATQATAPERPQVATATAKAAGGYGLKRGPKADLQSSEVQRIVNEVAPDGDWRSKLDEVCDALDNADVSPSMKWYKKDTTCTKWADQNDRSLCVKAIEYRLKKAKAAKPH